MGDRGFRSCSHAHARPGSRAVLHIGVAALLAAAIAFATTNGPASGSSTPSIASAPATVFSGLSGGASFDSAASFRPGGSHATRGSIQALVLRTNAPSLRSTEQVPPTASFSSGVTVAAASSGETASGVQPLADVVDPRQPFALYTAQPGDSVGRIAELYGISPQTLIAANPEIRDGVLILVGQQLVVPRADGVLYSASFGETLAEIIDDYNNVTVDEVLAFRPNNLSDPTNIEAGRRILLPNAVKKPPPPPPPPPPPAATGGGITNVAPPPSSGGRFSSPLGAFLRVSDPFGTGRGAGLIHEGIDLDLYGYPGSPIFSACEGTVVLTEYLTYSYGYHVIVDCGDGWSTLYAHMSEIHVSPGQAVSQGTQLGRSGLTGYTTGEHLHFEIRYNGHAVNPADYVSF